MSSVAERTKPHSRDDGAVANGPIVIATDGRPECAAVLAAGRLLAARLDADYQVVAAYPELAPLVPDPRLLLDHGLTAKLRGDLTQHVRSQCAFPPNDTFGLEAPRIEVLEGAPAMVIARAADERDAQLIVLGLGRHDVLERLFGDETALQVVRASHVPVLALPDREFIAPRSAIVGVDFSEISLRAAEAALRLLDVGAVLRLVYVVPKTRTILDDLIPRDEEERYLRHRFTQFLGRLTIPAGIAVGEVTLDGDPARELLRYAEETGADFVAAGIHGHGFVESKLVGSVATKLLRGAQCGVLIVPSEHAAPGRRRGSSRGLTMRFDETRWAEVLDDFTRSNVGRRTRLEVDDPEIGAQAQEEDYRLLGVTFDPHDGRIEIMLGELGGGEPHLSRSIAGVDSLYLLSDIDGRDLALRLRHGAAQTILTLLR
jgi:nucleotide-binding universal stress UspA family protein